MAKTKRILKWIGETIKRQEGKVIKVSEGKGKLGTSGGKTRQLDMTGHVIGAALWA